MRDSLAQKSVRGTLWSAAGRLGNQAIRVASIVVLARLLTPADFGVVGMVLAIVGMAFVLQDLGFSGATISNDYVTHDQVSNLFWLNSAAGILAMGALMAAAPMLERFYGDPRISEATLAMATVFGLAGVATQHRALLTRALALQLLAGIAIASSLATAIVSTTLAWVGGGHWALIWGILIGMLVSTVGVWLCCDWRPALPKFGRGTRPMVFVGSNLALHGLLGYVAHDLPGLLIGRLWSAADAGIYGRAATISQLLLSNIVTSVGQVAPAAMSRLSAEPEKFAGYYYKTCTLLALAGAPLMFVGLVLPTEFVLVFLGETWRAAAPLLLLISIGLLPQALLRTTGWVFLSKGRSADMVRWGSFGWIVLIVATLLGAFGGLAGIAISISLAAWLLVVPTLRWSFAGTNLTLGGVCRALSGPLLAAGISGAVGYAVLTAFKVEGAWQRLLGGCVTFALVDVMLLLTVFSQRPLLMEIVGRLQDHGADSRGPPSLRAAAEIKKPRWFN